MAWKVPGRRVQSRAPGRVGFNGRHHPECEPRVPCWDCRKHSTARQRCCEDKGNVSGGVEHSTRAGQLCCMGVTSTGVGVGKEGRPGVTAVWTTG